MHQRRMPVDAGVGYEPRSLVDDRADCGVEVETVALGLTAQARRPAHPRLTDQRVDAPLDIGNDVNLRGIEGRSALPLSKAKDNNASCAIGPLVRLFDAGFIDDDVRRAELSLSVEGPDGFMLRGRSSIAEISRDPEVW